VVLNSAGRLGTAPAALKGESQTLTQLRAEVKRQRVAIRQQDDRFAHQIQQLREQVRDR
jgi:hypothetical protein